MMVDPSSGRRNDGKDSDGWLDDFSNRAEQLYRYGLTPLQSKIFVSLLRFGPISVKDLSRRTGVNRVDIYRVLDSLRRRGLVEVTVQNPSLFSAVPPNQAMMLLLEEEEDRFKALRAGAKDVFTWLKSIRREPAVSLEEDPESSMSSMSFKVISGRQLFETWRRMLQGAREEAVAVWSSWGLGFQARRGFFEPYVNCIERGLPVRVVTYIDDENMEYAKKYSRVVSLRHNPLVNTSLRYLIVDGKLTSIAASVVPPPHDNQPTSIWTNSKAFTDILKREFEGLWDSAQDVNSRLAELGYQERVVSRETLHDMDLS